MRITVHAIGRMKSGPENELVSRYAERSSKSGKAIGISSVAIRDFAESRRADRTSRCDEEAAGLLGGVGAAAFVIALDERGEDVGSIAFSQLLRSTMDAGIGELAFLIGGPDGHGRACLERAKRTIRLGSMTWPHQFVRIMLCEQIYRAVTILSGHPYHRE
jgi:23S rRNA (pseudouridine1915-N3)-methyltransferase